MAGSEEEEGCSERALAVPEDQSVAGDTCPVCYAPFSHPVVLPCNHIFCFTCAKGFINRSRCCALCRRPTPTSYLTQPNFLKEGVREGWVSEEAGAPCWFYSSKSVGWWRYEDKNNQEIEEHFQENSKSKFDLQLAGYMYTIDLLEMVQYRRGNPQYKRSIKRAHPQEVEDLRGQAGAS